MHKLYVVIDHRGGLRSADFNGKRISASVFYRLVNLDPNHAFTIQKHLERFANVNADRFDVDWVVSDVS
jgi:hypothetical protein